MDIDMDIDMDMDLNFAHGEDAVPSVCCSLRTCARSLWANPNPKTPPSLPHSLTGPDSITPAVVSDRKDIASNKVYIRGLDELTTEDIRSFALEQFTIPPERVEWIDDTSANLVFSAPSTASDALRRLTSPEADLPIDLSEVDLRPATSASSHPHVNLQVRIALVTDRKRARAHETSRFYLLHPECDPREQRRRDRHSDGDGDGYRKRRYSHEEDRRRRRRNLREGFHEFMYDDGNSVGTRDAAISSPLKDHRSEVELRLLPRDRSASPRGRGERHLSRHRRRSRFSGSSTRHRDDLPVQHNEEKELFPHKATRAEGRALFSNQVSATRLKKELFPNRNVSGSHRRTDAFDAADETADLFAHKLAVPFMDGALGEDDIADSSNKKRPKRPMTSTKAQARTSDLGLSIRGTSTAGFSIKGGASQDLFPSKINAGKELFAEKLVGRGGPRIRAEDLFN